MSDLEKKKDLSEKIYNHRGYIHACASQKLKGWRAQTNRSLSLA